MKWYKSQPINIQFDPSQLDEENGIIRDVVMVEAGPAKGHGVHLEPQTIESIVQYDIATYVNRGLKARFGHPAMSDTTMGKQMGYFHNFRYKDGKAYADLHFLEAAEISPTNPGMKSWMFQMAKEAQDFVMSSIVFAPSGYYQYNPENNQSEPIETTSWGDPIPTYADEPVYVDFNTENGAQHFYTDLVEAGAATDALFSAQFNDNKFAVRTVEWLRENNDILTFIQQNPHKLIELAEKLNIPIMAKNLTEKKKSLFNEIKNLFFSDVEETPEEATPEVEEVVEEVVEAQVEDGISIDEFNDLRDQLTQLQETNANLLVRIDELEKAPAVPPAAFKEEKDGEESTKYLCPTTRKAMGKK